MSYTTGNLSSSASSKCIIYGKSTATYLTISNYPKNGEKKLDTSLDVPVCDEHYKLIFSQREILIAHVKLINKLLKTSNVI